MLVFLKKIYLQICIIANNLYSYSFLTCVYHFRRQLDHFKQELTEENANLPKIFFDIHNRVHALRREQYPFIKEPDYTAEEYQSDSAFMLEALSVK